MAAAAPPSTAAKANTCLILQIMGISGGVNIQKGNYQKTNSEKDVTGRAPNKLSAARITFFVALLTVR